MEVKGELSVKDLEALGYADKYFELREDCNVAMSQQVLSKIAEIGYHPEDIVIREFSKKRVLDMLQSGTNRINKGISMLIDISSSLDPHLDKHVQIMEKRGLRNDQVTWGLQLSTENPLETIRSVYRNMETDAIALYRAEDLEFLDSSFMAFKTDPQHALIGVFANQPLEELEQPTSVD